MKRIVLFMIGTTVFLNSGYAQNILVANNNPGAASGVNVFTDVDALRDAFTAATAGDIIYVVPSPTSYGNLSITKSITIFGVGSRPAKALGAKSLVGLINIDASNVRLSGLISTSSDINLGWNVGTSNLDAITIENCRLERILMEGTPSATISNILIRNNIITGNGCLATHILLNTTSNALITNNVFTEGNLSCATMVQALNATFTYNLFADNGGEAAFAKVVNCIFDHNIFYGVSVAVGSGSTGNSWTYNLSFGSSDPNNIFNVIDDGNNDILAPGSNIESVGGSNDPLFVNFPLTQAWNNSYNFSIQAGSPALSTDPLNTSSEDIGPSGGATPFDFEGNLLPLIESVSVPSVIPIGTDLPVTIKAKGN